MNKRFLTAQMKDWIYTKWCEGYTEFEIAVGVCMKTVQRALKGKPKIKPVLVFPWERFRED